MLLSRCFGFFMFVVMVIFSIVVFVVLIFINIFIGGISGVYYFIGVGFLQIYGYDIQGVKILVQVIKVLVENFNLLQVGCGELVLVLGDLVVDVWNGVVDVGFKVLLKKLWVIGNIYLNYIQVVVS